MEKIKISNLLEEALKKFNGGRNWVQGAYEMKNQHGEDSFCSIGALNAVAREAVKNQHFAQGEIDQARALIGLAAGTTSDGVINFNDRSTTKYQDVEKAFKRAVAAARTLESQE